MRETALELVHRRLRDAEGPHLAGRDELGHRAPRLLDGRLRVHAVQVVEVDGVDAEPTQRAVARIADVLGPPVPSVTVRRPVLEDETALRREHDPLAPSRERAADERLVCERAVHVGGVEVLDAEIDRPVDEARRARGLVDRGIAIGPGQPHAAEPHGEDRATRREEPPPASADDTTPVAPRFAKMAPPWRSPASRSSPEAPEASARRSCVASPPRVRGVPLGPHRGIGPERAARFAKEGLSVRGFPADARREEDQKRLVESAARDGGRLDVLVNNAGIGRFAPSTRWSRSISAR